MPTSPVFPDILTTDSHVVYVDFGYFGSVDFASEPSISSYGTESAIIIPFLADGPNGIPKYALTLGQIYQRDRGDIARVNINSPYYGIDEVIVTETGAVWKNGSEELRVSFVKSNPCQVPKPYRQHQFDVLVEEELQFSFTGPDLGYCDRHLSVENPVCEIMEGIKTDVDELSPNVCQFYQPTSKGSCEASLTFESITDGFRDLLLVKDDPIAVLNSERFYDDFDISLKYPCME
ncbi:hypothetical protein HOLleu_38500 [Holothuria leucospilota]|uniref:Uncharacterized protein n=1 Tax=Holothuria leucospilota TaxID=206669 RepID=A0A9Q1BE55_HOLLE|nr:hypothetical protein HOLleu_38500 [Holothuria leucospilota]